MYDINISDKLVWLANVNDCKRMFEAHVIRLMMVLYDLTCPN